MTFAECAAAYIKSHEAAWTQKHTYHWHRSVTAFALPIIGTTPVNQIDTQAILQVLQPIWGTKSVTASRLRNRLELVLDAARAQGQRSGENPARWRGHLDKLLPRPSKLRAVEHHASMPYREIATFVLRLRQQDYLSARALEFIVLTAARAGEVLGMTWAEVDLDAKLWIVPARRMKGRREHRVPLSGQAIAILRQMPQQDERIFPISLGSLVRLRQRMALQTTVHGLRSSFRTWAAECTGYPREIIELCLAHKTGSAVELAYQRSDQLEKRRQLMQAWADYCDKKSAEVVQLRA